MWTLCYESNLIALSDTSHFAPIPVLFPLFPFLFFFLKRHPWWFIFYRQTSYCSRLCLEGDKSNSWLEVLSLPWDKYQSGLCDVTRGTSCDITKTWFTGWRIYFLQTGTIKRSQGWTLAGCKQFIIDKYCKGEFGKMWNLQNVLFYQLKLN